MFFFSNLIICCFLAAPQLTQADAHGAVFIARFLRHAPAQVNALEAQAFGQTELPELGGNIVLQYVSFSPHIREGRANK
jgi:hypothetical protein